MKQTDLTIIIFDFSRQVELHKSTWIQNTNVNSAMIERLIGILQ